MLRLFWRSARSMNLLVVEVGMPKRMLKQNIGVTQLQCCSGTLRRPGDHKLRCTLTRGVSQILYFTKLISEIKVYSFQRSFILSMRLFTTISNIKYQIVNLNFSSAHILWENDRWWYLKLLTISWTNSSYILVMFFNLPS